MKKLLLLSVSMLFAGMVWAGLVGDANNDGNVDVADITAIASHILGNTPESFNAENADVNGDGTIDVADITATAGIILNGPGIEDNTVIVNYADEKATVQVANNIKDLLAVTINGADVSILADPTLDEEVNYILSGSTADGKFQMDGEYKCTFTLNGVNITNNDDAAFQIDCGKRIAIVVADGTRNSFTDGKGSQKACFFVNGHAEFEGAGTLAITGKSKHAYRSDEYTQFKKKFTGFFIISGSASDGMHVGQYFQMNAGNLNIYDVAGDGIQVEAETESEEADNGKCIIKNGRLDITTDGIACDGIKADSLVSITGGEINILCRGGAEWDDKKIKVSGSAGISAHAIDFASATLNIKATGAGGKGISVDDNATFDAATIVITTLGEVYEENGDDTKPQCIKADSSIYVKGGIDTRIETYSAYGKGFSYDDEGTGEFVVDGVVLAIGEKASKPTGGSMPTFSYKGQNIQGGQTYTINGLTFTVPEDYNHSSAKILVAYPEE